jgi:hypothetical protein
MTPIARRAPGNRQLGYDDVAPDASAMIESMRAYGYTLPAALADIIDNSIAAGASNVDVRIHWAGYDSWIAVTDDGGGMSEEELRDAMRLGSRSPLEDREPEDLGRFGLGLKTASLSQCRRLTVVTRGSQRDVATRRWDLDHLARPDVTGWQLLRTAAEGSEERASLPATLPSGTRVLWERLDRLTGEDRDEDIESLQRHFMEMIERVEAHLSMVFHRFISKRRLRLRLNDREVRPWDPFLETHPATQCTPEEPIRIAGHVDPILIRGFILPHRDHLTADEHAAASGPAGWNAQQGFYLYRGERLIVAGSWLGLGAGRPWTQEEHYKLARIRIDIPNSMDHLWHLDVKKSSASPPPGLRERLKGMATTVRSDARSVFAHRGKYGKRAVKTEVTRPWKVVRTAASTSYRIDRGHPIVAALIASLPGEAGTLLETTLRIVEETVPVEQIWLDTADRPDAPAPPFDRVGSTEARTYATVAYRALRRNSGRSHAETVALLCASQEFASSEFQAIIATLEETGS